MTSTEIASASKIILGTTEAVAMYIGSEQLWPVDLHEYVEIDGLKWATMNIGASSVTDKGLLYAWGETEGYNNYKDPPFWSAYKYDSGTNSHTESDMTKYNTSDGKTVLDLSDDAARINWGGNWRMPSVEEWKSLINNTNQEYTNNYYNSGVKGWLCTDKTDSNKKLFFPVNVELKLPGSSTYFMGFYYSNLLYIEDKTQAFRTGFRSSGVFTQEHCSRYIVNGVRAVIPHDYSLDYFTIESLEDSNTIRIEKNGSAPNISLSYSTDNGTTWTDLTVSASIDLTTIDIGDKIIFKGINSTLSSKYNAYWRFAPSKNFNVYGNAMSLLFGDNFINNSEFASGTTLQLNGLFYNTATLINAKNLILPATTVTNRSYYRMFQNCTSLTTAPELPATTLADYCYYGMFCGCTSLTAAPSSLPATTLADHCYYAMFAGCTLLNHVKALFTTDISLKSSYTNNWLMDVAATGTFIKNKNATWSKTGASGIPSGWTVELYEPVMDIPHDYSLDYFTIESLEDGNEIKMQRSKTPGSPTLSYSLDDGETWTSITINGAKTFATINTGDKIIFKGTNTNLASAWDAYNYFNATKQFKVYGNIMSLFNGDNFSTNHEFNSSGTHLCAGLFRTTYLVDASNLILPALTLYTSSYNGMFRGATALQHGPQMLATTPTGTECCSSMFEGCINLEEPIEIKFTTLTQQCCMRMFCMNRNSKITTPKMTKSPILRCANTAQDCYKEMFKGNGNLTEITCLKTDITSACSNWVTNISTTGTFYKASLKNDWPRNDSGIPSGWTVVDYTES